MKGSALRFGRQLIRSRHRQLLRTWHNVRVTSLCGLLTLLVLRSYLGAGKFVTPLQDYYDIRDHLHSFKLKHVQHKLLLRRSGQLTKDAGLLKDTLRSTLSVRPLEESYRSGKIFRGRNPAHMDAVSPSSGSLPATPRPHILLVTGSPSCANATEAQFLLKMLTNKMDYCRLHGIEVFPDPEVSSASSQSRLLQELMVSHPQVEWIWWMDSLAIFTNLSYHVEFERYAGYNVVMHAGSDGIAVDSRKDTMMVVWDRMWEGGSFLVRSCDSMRNFLADAGRQTEAMEVFMERTWMGRNEEGAGGEGEAWPLVMHLGQRCGLCGKGSKKLSCVTEAEIALNHAERSQKKPVGSA